MNKETIEDKYGCLVKYLKINDSLMVTTKDGPIVITLITPNGAKLAIKAPKDMKITYLRGPINN